MSRNMMRITTMDYVFTCVVVFNTLMRCTSGYSDFIRLAHNLEMTAHPSPNPEMMSQLNIDCQVPLIPPPGLSKNCQLQWSRAYLPPREGPSEKQLKSRSSRTGGGLLIYELIGQDGRPYRSTLKITEMTAELQGIYRCALICTDVGTLADGTIQIGADTGSSFAWIKKDVAMTMVSLVVIVFVFTMLIAGLVLRIRQCWKQRQFQLEQEHLTYENYDSGSQTSSESLECQQPPPRYSLVVDNNSNYPSSKDKNAHAQLATAASNIPCQAGTLCPQSAPSSDQQRSQSMLVDMEAVAEEEGTEQDILYTLTDHSDSGSFDSALLSISLPGYEEALEQLEKRGVTIDPSKLKPMPPAYSRL